MIMEKKYLIICDDLQKAYITHLSDYKDFRFVLSEKELDEIAFDDFANYNQIIIFAELNWNNKSYSNFYGLDIAVLLRLKFKVLATICILSFLPKEYFDKLDEKRIKIIKARGTCFKQWPVCFSEIESTALPVIPLSKATLAYLSTLLVDIKSIIIDLKHLRMNMDIDYIRIYLKRLEQFSKTNIYPKLQDLSNNIISTHNERDEGKFFLLIDELTNTLNVHSQNIKQDMPLNENKRSKILLLDDDDGDLKWAKDALSPYFEVISFQDGLEAKAYIEQDRKNELSAVICDWKLLKKNSNEYQDLLGFEVLEFASKNGHYALFSLTSTDDFSLHEIDIHLDFDHIRITKDFYKGVALWRMLIPIIQQKIDRTLMIIADTPTGEAWTSNYKIDYKKENGKSINYKKYFKSFKEQYIERRNSIDWSNYENNISVEATKCWEYYKIMLDEERTTDDRHNLYNKWGIELNRELKNLLIIRRLYIAFWLKQKSLYFPIRISDTELYREPTIISIYSVLNNRYFKAESDKKGGVDDKATYLDLKNSANGFVNKLCIVPKILPQGVLPEEKSWLLSNNINIDKGIDNHEEDDEKYDYD